MKIEEIREDRKFRIIVREMELHCLLAELGAPVDGVDVSRVREDIVREMAWEIKQAIVK